MAQTDREALVALYNAAGGPTWKNNKNWNTGADLSEWHGIKTNDQGRVVELSLPYNNLRGLIPLELGNLGALTTLNLGANKLSGNIPPELGDLRQLQRLWLHDNHLTGPIPPELGDLRELRDLWLNNNKLTGHIPPQLGQLGALEHLILGSNKLDGHIPPQLGQLGALESLILAWNKLGGTIPAELGKLTALLALYLNGNELSGPIPPELGQLQALQTLNLSYNQLSGNIPPELGDLRQLKRLCLNDNHLTGSIPKELKVLSRRRGLHIHTDQLPAPAPPVGGLGRFFAPLRRLLSRGAVRLGMRSVREDLAQPKPEQLMSGEESINRASRTKTGIVSLKLSEAKTATDSEPPVDGVMLSTLNIGPLLKVPPRSSGTREAQRECGEQRASRTVTAKNSPPQLQQVLPFLLTFLDSRSWCACLVVSTAAHDAVRALFKDLVPGGPRPDEGWTVPLDVLTLKTDEKGKPQLAANECGIAIDGAPGDLAHLKAMIIPAPQSGFLHVAGQLYIATSPILRCRWTGNDRPQGRWTVSFPLEEDHGLSNPTEISQVLRRGDDPRDEWEVQTAGLKACTRHPSMQVEVTHFSDVMTADKLREIEKTSPSSFYKRKRVWGTKLFSRYVHVYNASPEPMTVLQVLPAVMESGRGVQLSLPLFGGGGGGNRDITIHDGNTIEVRQVAAWANAVDGSGSEPPSYPAKFETLLGTKEMRVVPYTATGSREENNLKVFPREFFHCSAGYDYYLLQKMINGSLRPRFWEGDVGVDMSEERRVMDIVNR